MTATTTIQVEVLHPPTNLGWYSGLQKRTDVEDPVPVCGPAMTFEAEVSIVERDDELDFRGPYVHGPRGDRFIYLVWLQDRGGGLERMSRTKIILDEIPHPLLDGATGGTLVASFQATSATGGLLTGRVRPDAVSWRLE